MLAEEDRHLIGRLAVTADKLLLETTRLRGDVARLHSRIEPFEHDVLITVREPDQPAPKSLKAALQMLAQCRQGILDCEHDINAIRGRLDNIASDAITRAEMKPWLK